MSSSDIIIMFAPLAAFWLVLTVGFAVIEFLKWRQE
jgi:hypothetical protein